MNKSSLVIAVLAFLTGILVCHLFYYSHTYLAEKRIKMEIERLKREYNTTQVELERMDSLLNELN